MDAILPKKSNTAASEGTFQIRQAVVAMGLNAADDTTLDFLAALSGKISLQAAFFLHVQPRFDLLGTLFEREAQSVVSNYDFHTDLMRQLEKTVHQRFSPKGPVRIETDIHEGNPLEELLRQSTDLKADLLVAGKNTSGTTHGILSGNLVRKTRCSTLVVPDKALPRLERMLIPVDFSPYSIRALQTAESIAAQLAGRVEVIVTNAYDLPSIMAYRINKTEEELNAIIEYDRKEALEDFLRNFAPQLSGHCRLMTTRIEGASIAEKILEMASAEHADLIIMGAKGHSKVELLLMGSVTESLLQINDTIPVWVVK